MDIEERAEKYAEDAALNLDIDSYYIKDVIPALRDAYLAGSAQTQQDYTRSDHRFSLRSPVCCTCHERGRER